MTETSEPTDEGREHLSENEGHEYLSEITDGCGCAEVWEHLSERREDSD